ncbi:MAG: hypothetical protein GY710_25795 [Desulfobacteraceae bacterium]|nr:hypothetical protein [Desulfobacteraceae bacterium]
MSLFNKEAWLIFLLVFLCLAVPFGITYYGSNSTFNDQHKRWQPQSSVTSLKMKSYISADQLLLVRNDRVKVKNTCLVFKGFEKGQIMLDLYLLELDPGYAYPQQFSRQTNGNVIRLGDVIYAIKSVNKYSLTLKVLENVGTD